LHPWIGGERADVVELTGLGRTLADGHFHETRWSGESVDRAVGIVIDAGQRAGRTPVLGALVQHLDVVDDAVRGTRDYLERVAEVLPPGARPSVDDALACPYLFVGTVDDIVTKMTAIRDRWGITRFTVRSLDAATRVLDAMR
jgi:hypothetical protein